MKKLIWKNLSQAQRQSALMRPAVKSREDIQARVAQILKAVSEQGDEALRLLTEELDGVSLKQFEASALEHEKASAIVDPKVRQALEFAAANIEAFHCKQVSQTEIIETFPGVTCERQFRPVARVGLYVPGGTAALPSTVLMLGIPSRLAKNPLRILCTPPRKDGSVDPHVLVAAGICGIERVFKMGGAQAIAAMAYGTKSVPQVDKIFGPGNAWVTEAKEQVSRGRQTTTGIDMPAGPSEVLVIGDRYANPKFIAADLLSQAEHGSDSQVVLVTDSTSLLTEVERELDDQLRDLPRANISRKALEKSVFVVVDTLEEAFEVSNAYAPEHLILQVRDAQNYKQKILNAGSVFLGAWSPESAGDYASGTNHVLPTYGHARTSSGLSVDSFMKQISFQELSKEGLRGIAPAIETLAGIEKLEAHRRAVSLRLTEMGAL
jgi:histidinol dehydrogenase